MQFGPENCGIGPCGLTSAASVSANAVRFGPRPDFGESREAKQTATARPPVAESARKTSECLPVAVKRR